MSAKDAPGKDPANSVPGLGQANSIAPPPSEWSVVKWPVAEPSQPPTAEPQPQMVAEPQPPQRQRKGPAPGSLDRFGPDDRELFPAIKRLMQEKRMSLTAATQQLAADGKVKGPTAAPATPLTAAERMRRHRERRRNGMRCLTIELHETEIDVLIGKGTPNADARNDQHAICQALYGHLQRTL